MPHRPTLKKSHKAFKSRHASKSALKTKSKGKIEKAKDKDGKSKGHSTKQDRRNTANQLRANKILETEQSKKLFEGRNGAPKIVSIVPLSPDCDPRSIVGQINASVGVEMDPSEIPGAGVLNVSINRFKQKLTYIIPPRNFVAILDAAKVADIVVFVLSANEEVDEFGELCIRSIESQGVSTAVPVIHGLTAVDGVKKQAGIRGSLLSFFSHFFPTTDKIYSPDVSSEALNVGRLLCQKFPHGVNWRDSRFYMLADDAHYDNDKQMLSVEGVVRGKGLNTDRLVHIPGFGDFQIDRAVSVADKKDGEMDDDNNVLAVPTENQDSLDELAPEADEAMDEMEDEDEDDYQSKAGIRVDGHHYFREDNQIQYLDSEEEQEEAPRKRKLPKGMSEYQATWIVDDEDLVDSDADEEEEQSDDEAMMDDDQDEEENGKRVAFSEAGTEYEPSEMFQDLSAEEESRQLQEFRERAREDLEFPDEIELNPNESAKERLKRYRGAKNLRSADWDVNEKDPRAPEEWPRLTRVLNYAATRNRVLKQQATEYQVEAGTRVRLFIRAPEYIASAFSPVRPLVLYGLLEHEHKLGYLNTTIIPHSEYEEPIAAKDNLIMMCGPRRLMVRPVFSQAGSNSPNNVYKYERFLQPGRSSTASMIAPLMFGSVPILYFKQNQDRLDLVATGSVMDANHNRILVRRAVLTGHPLKIHKKLVTIRYMFFNPEDVNWFKAVPLFTKHGRSGYIKESLGTHGYFKATFDGRITSQDTVAMALYKRVWPRASVQWTGGW